MIRFSRLLSLVAVVVFAVGCGPLTFEDTVKVRVTLGEEDGTDVSVEKAVDLSDNAEFKEISKRAKAPRIKEIRLSDASQAGWHNVALTLSGRLEIAGTEEGATPVLVSEYTGYEVGGDEVSLDVNEEALATVEALLRSEKPAFKAIASATADQVPLDTELTFTFVYEVDLDLF